MLTVKLLEEIFILENIFFLSNKTDFNKAQMPEASKQYKRTINNSVVNFKRNYKKKIRAMRSKSPKEYWNYINSINRKARSPEQDINFFHDFFKKLNNNVGTRT